ncbi:hypothetical protein C2E23DRAFT_510658 [Lenzites betulinus]|nr:hypothetical protein C2E23DRAFT_510658 [Lenzites betulinus]
MLSRGAGHQYWLRARRLFAPPSRSFCSLLLSLRLCVPVVLLLLALRSRTVPPQYTFLFSSWCRAMCDSLLRLASVRCCYICWYRLFRAIVPFTPVVNVFTSCLSGGWVASR